MIAFVAGILILLYTDSMAVIILMILVTIMVKFRLYEHVWHYTILNFLFASFILSIVSVHSKKVFASIRSALESNWMVRIGKVSYGMYLFHWAILVYVCNHLFTTQNLALKTLVFIPYVFIVYLFAELSFRLYESRFLKLKDSLFVKKKTRKTQVLSTITDSSSVLKPISNE